MQSIPLGSTGRITSRLGFGCSSIMGALNRRQSLTLLETAFDAGIRHFDTAPMYGYGDAESCLGDFLARHPDQVTITTKFGIPAAKNRPLIRIARTALGPLVQRFPALKKGLQRTAQPVITAPQTPNPIFSVNQARASLETSLTALKTERIDVWLLHEVNAIDLTHDSLLRFLEDAVREGKIGTFGVGSERTSIPGLIAKHPGYCRVAQYEWSVLNPSIPETPYFRIHHRALSKHFHALIALLQAQPEQCKRWSAEIGADLASPSTLANLMLKASFLFNSASILLFSSKNSEHIHANVAIGDSDALDASARQLYKIFQRDLPNLTDG
jgi:D-threo-aldose 1-dehydrogenase